MSKGIFADLKGKKYGRLLVIKRAARKTKNTYWDCLCSCGVKKDIRTDVLVRGLTKSCGCLTLEAVTKHGATAGGKNTRAFNTWAGMSKRCTNPRNQDWKYYGGRGVRVCERWKSFENFHADMGDPPPGMSIDRIDTNGDYEPGNCRWADATTQSRNRRRTSGWKLER